MGRNIYSVLTLTAEDDKKKYYIVYQCFPKI